MTKKSTKILLLFISFPSFFHTFYLLLFSSPFFIHRLPVFFRGACLFSFIYPSFLSLTVCEHLPYPWPHPQSTSATPIRPPQPFFSTRSDEKSASMFIYPAGWFTIFQGEKNPFFTIINFLLIILNTSKWAFTKVYSFLPSATHSSSFDPKKISGGAGHFFSAV